MGYPKPLPVIDHLSAPFWEACRNHELRLQCCDGCGQRRFPAGPICHRCGSKDSTWTLTEGRARVYSWIVVRHPIPADVYDDEVPYVVALVEFADGVRMPTNITGCDPETVVGGMEVVVTFEDIDENITLPKFAPV